MCFPDLLHGAVSPEKWTQISSVVTRHQAQLSLLTKESTKTSAVNVTDLKRKLLQSICDIAGIDLWEKVVMELCNPQAQQQGIAVQELLCRRRRMQHGHQGQQGQAGQMQKRQVAEQSRQMAIGTKDGAADCTASGGSGQGAPGASGSQEGSLEGQLQPTVGQVINAVKRQAGVTMCCDCLLVVG